MATTAQRITPWRAFKADPADWFSPEEVARAKRYARGVRWINGLKTAMGTAAMLALITSKTVPRLVDGPINGMDNWVLQLFVAIAVVAVVETVVAIAFDAYRALGYDKRWEFSTQTPRIFVTDLAKSLPLGIVIYAVLFVPLWILIRATDLWWVWGWGVFAVFIVMLLFIFPVAIAPIFNKYTPVEEGELRTQLLGMATKVGADISEYLVEDASKRDVRQNAYVTGLGKTRRAVIYDTMLPWPPEQVTAVVAHEIGHWKLRHIRRTIPAVIALSFANFVILKVVMGWDIALDLAGVDSVRDPGAFPLFSFVFPIGFLASRFGSSWLSRAHEREADLFALRTTTDAPTFVGMMRRLHTDNLADLAPSLWKRITHTHPPAAERMAMATAWESQTGGG